IHCCTTRRPDTDRPRLGSTAFSNKIVTRLPAISENACPQGGWAGRATEDLWPRAPFTAGLLVNCWGKTLLVLLFFTFLSHQSLPAFAPRLIGAARSVVFVHWRCARRESQKSREGLLSSLWGLY